MKRVRVWGVVWACLACSSVLRAQSEPLPVGPWAAEVAKWVETTDAEAARWIRKDLAEKWEEGALPPGRLDTLQRTLALLQKDKTFKPAAGIDYLRTADALAAGVRRDAWGSWHGVVQALAGSKSGKKALPDFLAGSLAFFDKGILSDRPQAVWRLEGAGIDFRTDSVPFLPLQGVTLVGECTGDRLEINDVWGSWRIADGEVRIDSARMQWQGTELDPATHTARLGAGTLPLDKEGFDIEQANLVTDWFPEGLAGSVRIRLVRNRNPEDVAYPRFDSEEKFLVLDSIQPGMRFIGGISVRGGTLAGVGAEGYDATIEVLRKDTLLFRTRASEFRFDVRGFSAVHASMAMYWEDDSVYHPDLRVRYARQGARLTFLRERDGLGMRPFSDTYHDVVFEADAVTWVLDAATVEVGSLPGTADRRASFRSTGFFREQAFDAMRGIDPIHPLVELMQFVRKTGQTEFSTTAYSRHIKLSETQTQMILLRLALEGYIELNLDTWRCSVLDKASATLDHARGALDYDVLAFESQVRSGPNAAFSLLNGRLNLEGVEVVQASDSQSVRIYPREGRLSLGRNRSFTFEGTVRAGNLEFSGQGFTFDYEQFLIQLNRVDALHLMVTGTERDARGLPVRTRVKNALSEVSGTLAIDHPLNRSGTRSAMYPDFPYFTSDSTSFVYFDEAGLRQDRYDRDRFYYAVEPFALRQIDRLEAADVRFNGTLVSADIFADHGEDLVLMPDNSLGLRWTTPQAGEAVYGGDARWFAEVTLDLGGLQGKGAFTYLTGKVETDRAVFLPDSMRAAEALCTNRLDRSLHVPQVRGEEAAAVFRPASRELHWLSGKSGFACLADSVRFDGDLRLSPTGLLGSGELAYREGLVEMERGRLLEDRVRADAAAFHLISPRTAREVLYAEDVVADVDFASGWGRFTYGSGERAVEFPDHRYRAWLDRLDWNMNSARVNCTTNRTFPESSPWSDPVRKMTANFISTAWADTLKFFAPLATFDVAENRLACTRVPELLVADARLVPRGGDVGIRENARHEPLIGAELFLPIAAPVHRILNASLEVQNGNAYTGSGDYVFEDGSGSGRTLPLRTLGVDEAGASFGTGKVEEKDLVYFDRAFQFKGTVRLNAAEPLLEFDGGVQLTAGCLCYDRSWLQFKDRINPSRPAIPVGPRPTDLKGDPLAFSWTESVGEPYGVRERFMSEIDTTEDRPLFRPTGWLRHSNGVYTVGDTARLVPAAALVVEGCKVTNQGEADLRLATPGIVYRFVGSGASDGNSSLKLQGVLSVSMPVDAKLWTSASRALPMFQTAADPDPSSSGMTDAIAAWAEPKDREDAAAEWGLAGAFRRIPKGMEATWMLTGVQLVWDAREDMWVSQGKIGVAWLGEEQVHRAVAGKLELARGRAGDGLRFYLHGDDSNWYFFDYRLNALGMSASDVAFLEAIGAIKEEKRSTQLDGDASFRYFPILQRKRRDDFVDAYREFE
jgi:hypothetical protein